MTWVTGDTHGDFNKLLNIDDTQLLKQEDYIIVCGDMGICWRKDKKDLKHNLEILSAKNFTILFVDGNHENFDILNSYPSEEWNGGKVHKLSENVIHLCRGSAFQLNDCKILVMGGAESIDQHLRTPHLSWWKQENITGGDIANLNDTLAAEGTEYDYIFTHTCPDSIFAEYQTLLCTMNQNKIHTTRADEKVLEDLYQKIKFKHWYFGHFHQDIQLNNEFTVLYNSIREVRAN